MASADTPEQTRQITGGGFEGAEGVIWTSDGRIVFTSMESGNRDIWLMDGEGKNRSQLTFDKASDEYPSISKDGKIVFVSTRAGTPHVWQMNSDGAGLSQLTKKGGETFPSITPDGKTVIFSSPGEVGNILWKITTENGAEAVRLTNQLTRWSAVSPDGKTVACLSRKPEIDKPIELSIVSIEDGKFLKTFSLPGGVASPTIVPTIRWTQDGKSVGYVATTNGVSNLWRQAIDGGEPQKITNFSAERIFSFDWSADGKQIIYARGVVRSNMVLLEDF